jgi:hypothetical protein
MKCSWCLGDHAVAQCPSLVSLNTLREFGTVEHMTERSTADDVLEALQLRCHQLRAYARGLRCELEGFGHAPSPTTLALNPDGE